MDAALSLSVDSSSVLKAANDLDRFSAASDKAAAAGKKISLDGASGSIAKLVSAVQSIDSKLGSIVSAMAKLSAANDNVAASSTKAAASLNSLSGSFRATSGPITGVAATSASASVNIDGIARAAQQADAHVAAFRAQVSSASTALQQADAHVAAFRAQMAAMPNTFQQADAHVIAYRNSLAQVGEGARAASTAIKFSATDSLNATRQLADIGTTLAMGMSPFMVAIQQGPQLLDILQNKAAQTGQTLGAVFRAAAVAIYTALAPFLPIIAGIALAVGGIAAAFALGTREIEKGQGKVVDGLSLTEKQMERLKKKGVDTGVTIGDTFSAFFSVIKNRLADAFETPIKAVSKAWDSFLNDTTSAGRVAIKDIIGTFVGGYYAIVALWKTLPKTFEGIGALVANGFIAIIENMINRVIRSMNDLNSRVNEAARMLGLGDIIPKLQDVSLGRVANKEAEATASAIAKGYQEGYAAAGAATDRFFTDVAAKARENARKRIKAAAGDAEKTPKGPKTDAEKLADIYRNAQAEIAVQENRAKAVGMSARAATELEQRTKILQQIEKAGIPITAAVRAEVDKLAAAYAKAKIAADVQEALQRVTDGLTSQRQAIVDQTALLGLYGDALTRAKIEQEALATARAALPKGEVLTPAQEAAIKAGAGKVANAQVAYDSGARAEKLRKDAEDAAYAMDLEAKGLHLTGQAAIAYAFATDRLNEAKRAGIELSPDEIAAIKAAGDAYAAQRYAIDQQRKAIEDAREVTRGFFADFINGAREGQGFFKSFADSVVNSLNRIIDKLLDKALTGFIDGIDFGKGGSGGFLGGLFGGKSNSLVPAQTDAMRKIPGVMWANGGAFGTAQRFAQGGAFTNQIVTSPTLFRFAKGSALGEMGEAGPEAIMPLKRGPNGSLGVQMHGGGRPVIRMGDYNPTFEFAGAVGLDGIASLVRQGGEATYAQMKRDLQSLLAEIEQNGTVAT